MLNNVDIVWLTMFLLLLAIWWNCTINLNYKLFVHKLTLHVTLVADIGYLRPWWWLIDHGGGLFPVKHPHDTTLY